MKRSALLRKVKTIRQLKINILDRNGGTRNIIRNRNNFLEDKEKLKSDILNFIKDKQQISIKEVARIYYECKYIPKRETRNIIKELLNEKIIVRVDDVDYCGNKIDDVTINGLFLYGLEDRLL